MNYIQLGLQEVIEVEKFECVYVKDRLNNALMQRVFWMQL